MSENRRIIKLGAERYDVTDWTQGDIDQLFEDYKKHQKEVAEHNHAGRIYERQRDEGGREREL
jgi:hypothetical protein